MGVAEEKTYHWIEKILITYAAKMLILICLLIDAAPVLAQTTLFIESGKNDYSLSRHISILEDKAHLLSIREAASDSIKNKFVNLSAESPNLGFSRSAFWIRFEIADTLFRLWTMQICFLFGIREIPPYINYTVR